MGTQRTWGINFNKNMGNMSTQEFWIAGGICYQGATLNKYIKAAAIPDPRQCAGPELRNHGLTPGTCEQQGWTDRHADIKIDTCHLGPIPFGVWTNPTIKASQLIIYLI